VRLRSFRARHFGELIAGLRRLPWHAYVSPNRALDVRVVCHRSRLWHSEAVAERARAVIEHHLGQPLRPGKNADEANIQTVFVRIAGDIVQPSIDASGELLHRRGHRRFIGPAPLRETLAAALVLVLRSSTDAAKIALWDPFCGSGCIVVEWLESLLGWSSGRDRTFAFEQWPVHNAQAYARWIENRGSNTAPSIHAYGSDIEENVILAARANAQRSGAEPYCTFMCGDFESFIETIPRGTAIVTNPPYGVRSGDPHTYARLLERFEAMLLRRVDLRPVVALLPEPLRPWQPKLEWQPVTKLRNGGLPVQVLRLN
jgi:putative N6-adenine-specific DNA methylase